MIKNKYVYLNKTHHQSKGGLSMTKKLFATISTLAIMGSALLVGQQAFAAETAITGGALSFGAQQPSVGNFTAVQLNGQIQTTNATVSAFSVVDATGSGSGWNVMVKASQFATADNAFTLPENSLGIATPTVTAAEGASDVSTITKANGKIDNVTGVKILSAAVNGGMGTYNVDANNLALTLNPKDVKAGTYISTVTVTVTTGP